MRAQRHHQIAFSRAFEITGAVRDGFTLFEVVLALAIFLSAVSALSQLTSNGMRAAVQASLRTHAILRCESKLSEVLAGAEDVKTIAGVPFPDDPSWLWSLNVAEGPIEHLLELQVRVSRLDPRGREIVSYTLRQLVRDPQLFLQENASGPAEVAR